MPRNVSRALSITAPGKLQVQDDCYYSPRSGQALVIVGFCRAAGFCGYDGHRLPIQLHVHAAAKKAPATAFHLSSMYVIHVTDVEYCVANLRRSAKLAFIGALVPASSDSGRTAVGDLRAGALHAEAAALQTQLVYLTAQCKADKELLTGEVLGPQHPRPSNPIRVGPTLPTPRTHAYVCVCLPAASRRYAST